jgi:heat-inducible transcriptional repressor
VSELDARKQTILRAVVFEYVNMAEPVGSELLAQKYELGVKSATIRNELADLADLGYLEQPHTSAGRIPSDRGYRYYVDRLIVQRAPNSDVKQRMKKASLDGEALQDLLQETTRTLSRLTHLLTAATLLRDANVTVRNVMVSALGPQQALLVLVLSNGHVENRMIEVPAGLTLQDLGQANELLTQRLAGQSVRQAAKAKPPASPGSPALDKLLTASWNALRSISKEMTRGSVVIEGEEFLFAQPEFQRDGAILAELIDALKGSDLLADALAAPSDQPQPVTIGSEHRHEQFHRLSVVRHSFYVGDHEAGVIAVIGPTRMHYDQSIPIVSYAARALSDSLTRFFG